MSQLQLDSAISWAVAIANDNRYYYQTPPNPPFGMDCSYFVIHAFDQAGVDTHGATYTGDMLQCFTTNNTFTAIPFDLSVAQRGDVFLRHTSGSDGHTCIYLGNNEIVHAANSQRGIYVGSYYPNGYQYILRLTDQTPTSYSWHAQATGGYLKESVEAQENAILIYGFLTSLGWTLEAVCGLLGSIGSESGYNPWRWESDIVIASTDSYNISVSTSHGYGLVQFTPASKYVWNSAAQSMTHFSPNYSDVSGTPEDGEAQINFLDQFADYIPTTRYPQTYQEYKAFTGTPEEAASIWLYNYERGGYPTENTRREVARWWFTFLGGIIPPTPTRSKRRLPVWLIYKTIRKE